MLTRAFEVRAAQVGGDGRTLLLACVPYDVPTRVDDGSGTYREVFRHGAFRDAVKSPNRVELRYAHQQDGLPYGFAAALEETESALVGTFRVADSTLGEQALALVREKMLNGVSIGFVPGADRETTDDDGPLVERLRVKRLLEVSLTANPAYEDAQVLAVRQSQPDDLAAARARARWDLEKLRLRPTRM